MTAAEQQQCLLRLWPAWRAIATSTGRTNTAQAESAILRLYQYYRLAAPEIIWWTDLNRLPRQEDDAPLFTHARDTLIYSIWHHLNDPQWVCEQIGYNRRNSTFGMPLNNRVVLSTRPRTTRRAPWMLATNNVISQFDVDILAIQALGAKLDIPVDPTIAELTQIITEIVTACFGVVLFENSCWMIERPRIVSLNDGLQLAAQGKPAFETRPKDNRYTLYIANGRILSINEAPKTERWSTFMLASSQLRVALIEYIGWEAFLELAQHNRQSLPINTDAYGILHRITCGTAQYLAVQVQNSTREPDGTFRHYVIPVDSQCRPAPDPRDPIGHFGEPQRPTPLNAIGSSFGMTGEQYAAILGQET